MHVICPSTMSQKQNVTETTPIVMSNLANNGSGGDSLQDYSDKSCHSHTQDDQAPLVWSHPLTILDGWTSGFSNRQFFASIFNYRSRHSHLASLRMKVPSLMMMIRWETMKTSLVSPPVEMCQEMQIRLQNVVKASGYGLSHLSF